jgi:protein TonB
VVQVALISPQPVSAPPPPPPEKREPAPRGETLKPTDETGVKVAPLRPRKDEVEKPHPKKEPEPPPPATTVLPLAPAGSAGLSGDVTVDTGDFEFTYYLILVRNRIAENWSPPAGLATHGQPVRAVVRFRVDRLGAVSGVELESTSGAEFFDRSALHAVMVSAPMPPLPIGYDSSDLGIHFGFEYSTP